MARVLTDFLDEAVKKYCDKKVFVDEKRSITYGELQRESQAVAKKLSDNGILRQPVLILMPCCVECAVFVYGVAYSCNYYTISNREITQSNIEEEIKQFNPCAILTNDENAKYLKNNTNVSVNIITYEECMRLTQDSNDMKSICHVMSRDVILVVFTSGSTGKPKGVVISHEGMIDTVNNYISVFKLDENSRLAEPNANMFALFSINLFNIVASGGTEYIFNSKQLCFLNAFLDHIARKKMNRLLCIAPLLELVIKQNLLDKIDVSCLEVIGFGGTTISAKIINVWKSKLPETKFRNLYGATEAPVATYFEVNEKYDENVPMGKAVKNIELLILDEDKQIAKKGEAGELYIRSNGLALGYYQDKEKTDSVFVQNPLHSRYPDLVYRTGDIVRENEDGNLIFMGRNNSMIKRRGFRIELGEIDVKASSMQDIKECISIYNADSDKIYFFYEGEALEKTVYEYMKDRLRAYMLPDRIIKLDALPHGINSKVDRQALKKMTENESYQ